MKYPMYSYRDKLVGFGSPIVEISDQTAIRGFSMQMNNPQALMNFSAGDFDLYRVAYFDSDNGAVLTEKVPVLITSGVNVIGE